MLSIDWESYTIKVGVRLRTIPRPHAGISKLVRKAGPRLNSDWGNCMSKG